MHEFFAVFGYGSLVNRATHRTEIVAGWPARLGGWRRLWRPRPDMPGFPAALLTVEEEAGSVIDGLLVLQSRTTLDALDRREARYRRVEVDRSGLSLRDLPRDCPVYIYVAETEITPHRDPPRILRSYLDAVMQGIAVEHGEAALKRFVAETAGFETPVEEDRAHPRYPRAVELTGDQRRQFMALVPGSSGAGPCSPGDSGEGGAE